MVPLKLNTSVNLWFCKDWIPEQVINYLVRQRLLGNNIALKSLPLSLSWCISSMANNWPEWYADQFPSQALKVVCVNSFSKNSKLHTYSKFSSLLLKWGSSPGDRQYSEAKKKLGSLFAWSNICLICCCFFLKIKAFWNAKCLFQTFSGCESKQREEAGEVVNTYFRYAQWDRSWRLPALGRADLLLSEAPSQVAKHSTVKRSVWNWWLSLILFCFTELKQKGSLSSECKAGGVFVFKGGCLKQFVLYI